MARVYPTYYNPMVITAQVGIWRIKRILVDDGSNPVLKLFGEKKMSQNMNTIDTVDMYEFDGSMSIPVSHVLLEIRLWERRLQWINLTT